MKVIASIIGGLLTIFAIFKLGIEWGIGFGVAIILLNMYMLDEK